VELKPEMGGEDFGRYARHLKVPSLQFRIGAANPEAVQASRCPGGAALPPLHSSKFAPCPAPALRTGVRAMTNLALSLLGDGTK
jgi:hippurate hydrolase